MNHTIAVFIRFILLLFFLDTIIVSAQLTESGIDSLNSLSYEVIVSNLQKSIQNFNENLANARAINYARGEGIALSNLALVYYLKGNYDKSTQYHIESFKIFSDNKMFKELSDAFGEFGYQLKRRDLGKAAEYMQMAIKTADEHNIPVTFKSKLYDNYGVLKEMQNDANSAIFFYKKALEIKKTNRDTIGIPYSLNKIAVLNANQGKFAEAYKSLLLSDNYRKKEKGNFGRMENMAFHADFYRMENRVDDAITAYEKAKNMAMDINYTYMILYCFENLTNLYKQKKQFEKALQNHQQYAEYKDSIDNIETNTKVAQLEIAYETEQKNKLIAQNRFELQNKTQQLTFTLITLFLLSLMIVAVYKFQQQKRKRIVKEIQYKNELQNTEWEKKVVEEKLNISRELHDNIGSQLTFVISSLDNIAYSAKSNLLTPRLENIRNFSKEALIDLRSTIWAMKQEKGDAEKLILKITEMIHRLNSSLNDVNILLRNNLDKNLALSSTQMLNIFRIVQEALQNSIKYSAATDVKIDINKLDKGFELKIIDNGIGFNSDNSLDGNGLNNMKARCEMAGGVFSLNSKNGTIISCEFKIE